MIIHHNYTHSIRALILLLTVATMLGSCQKDKLSPQGQIRISVLDEGFTGQVLSYDNGSFHEQAQTQATENAYKTTFAAGDQIGLYAVKNDVVTVNNLKLTLTNVAGSLQWLVSGTEIPLDADRYFAYYPYIPSILSSQIIPTGTDAKSFFEKFIKSWPPTGDQSGIKYTSADLMVGMGNLGSATNHCYPLSFNLSHQMGLAVIKLPSGVTNPVFNGFTPFVDANGNYRFLIAPEKPKTLSCSFNDGGDVRGFVISATIAGGTYKTYTVSGKPVVTMSFKIDLSTFNASRNYNLPFKLSGTTGNYTLTVDWGDNSAKTTIGPNTDLSQAVGHNYADTREYTITITSSQDDFTKEQIPDFSPGKHRASPNNDKKFKAMLTPLLNTGQTDFSYCFSSTSIVEIPEDVFINNPQATDFSHAFRACRAITKIPEKLFAKNPEVTTFASTFHSCTSLASIPEALFSHHPKVESFAGTFLGCAIKTIPASLFSNNTAVKYFNLCFNSCLSLRSIPSGLFDNNQEVITFEECFYVYESNYSDTYGVIPAKLFANNLKVTSFKNCFYNQKKLIMNANIFCDETADNKANRFKDRNVNFDYCFANVGCDYMLMSAGTAPALWEYAGISSYTKCFNGVSKTTNIIDDNWK